MATFQIPGVNALTPLNVNFGSMRDMQLFLRFYVGSPLKVDPE